MFSVLSFFIPTSQKITNEIDLLNEMQNQSFDLNKSFFCNSRHRHHQVQIKILPSK